LILVLVIVLIYFAASLTISGEEFSPQLFQNRAFRYWRIPGTTVRLSSTTLGTPASLSSKQILNHLKTGPAVWQVTQVTRSTTEKREPQILVDALVQRDADGNNRWDSWSFRNPKRAAILWPVVQELASAGIYHPVPDLLRVAESDLPDSELNRSLKRIGLRAAVLKSKLLYDPSSDLPDTSWTDWSQRFSSDLTGPEIEELLALFVVSTTEPSKPLP
jgi:hypothetical protein